MTVFMYYFLQNKPNSYEIITIKLKLSFETINKQSTLNAVFFIDDAPSIVKRNNQHLSKL